LNHLERIVAGTRQEVAQRRAQKPEAEFENVGDIRSFVAAISGPGISLIAEHKRRSPSAGAIRDGSSVQEVVGAYERGGAAALSVLTEGPNFGGSLDDLREARAVSRLPILRKDFVVDGYQLHEARAAGADAVLLIVAALEEPELRAFHQLAADLGLAALVEAHDDRELETALEIGARLVGINSRDLGTLEVDPRRAFELIERVPAGVATVAESGLHNRAQLDELQEAGFDAVLMGEALMRSADIEQRVRELTAPTM
jgi:indole-3-glycerol phosphate synthase